MSDPRGGFCVCPGCGGVMTTRRVADAAVEVCVTCSGVWFDWFGGEAAALSRALAPGASPGGARARGAPRGGQNRCPRDGSGLESSPYLDVGPRVDRCPECLGLFARATTVPELAAFHDRIPERGAEPIERASLLARLWHTFVH